MTRGFKGFSDEGSQFSLVFHDMTVTINVIRRHIVTPLDPRLFIPHSSETKTGLPIRRIMFATGTFDGEPS